MAGMVIGSVKVRIVPDTTGFRRRVENEVLAETAGQGTKVKVSPDTDKFEREVQESVAKARASVENLKIRLTFDSARAVMEARKIDNKLKRMFGMTTAYVKVALNEASILAARAKLATLGTRLRLKNWYDGSSFEAQVNKMKNFLQTRLRQGLMAGLGNMAGLGTVMRFFSEKWEAVRNFDQIANKVGVIASGMSTVGMLMGNLVGQTISVLYSLKDLVGLLAILPGAYAAAAAGAYIFKVAFKDFEKYYPGFKQSWTEMEQLISKNFWSTAQKGMNGLIETTFPAFAKGMTGLSTNVGSFFTAFAQGITKNLTPLLPGIFQNMAKGFDTLALGMGNVTKGLSNVLAGSMKTLPIVAEWVNKITKGFGDWAEAANKNGSFEQWAKGGLAALEELGRSVYHLVGAIGGIGKAIQAAGGATLKDFADGLMRMNEAINSTSGQAAIMTAFTAMNTFTERFLSNMAPGFMQWISSFNNGLQKISDTIAGPLGTAFGNLFEGLSKSGSVENFAKGWEGIGNAITAIGPALTAIGEKVSVVFRLIGGMLQTVAPIMATLITEVANTIQTLAPYLEQVMGILGPTLESVMNSLTPILQGLAPIVGQLLVQIALLVSALVSALLPVIDQIWQALQPLLQQAMPLIAELVQYIISTVIPMMKPVFDAVVLTVQGIITTLSGLLTFIKGVFTADWAMIWEGIKTTFAGLWQVLQGTVQLGLIIISNQIKSVGMLITSIWTLLWTGIQALAGQAMNLVTALIAAGVAMIVGRFQALLAAAKGAWGQITSAFRSGADNAVSTLKSMGESILGYLGGLGGMMFSAGQKIIQGLIDGISSMVSAATGAVSNVVGAIREYLPFSPAKKGPLSGRGYTTYSGKALMRDFGKGMIQGAASAKSDLAGILSEMQGTFTPAQGDYSVRATTRIMNATQGDETFAPLKTAPAGGGMTNVWNVYSQDPNAIAARFNHEVFRDAHGSIHS